jgi:uncharacterized protein YkwD
LKLSLPLASLVLWLTAGVLAQPASAPLDELIGALSAIRSRGCDGRAGVDARLRPVARLGEAARRIARGESPADAARRAGYRATRIFVASMSGYESLSAVARTMAEKHCRALSDRDLDEIGIHRQKDSFWIVLAAPFAPPPPSAAAAVAARVLSLTNDARSRPRDCGGKRFEAAGPLMRHPLLDRAAAVHAQDMARHSRLEHEGRDGSGPAERVTRTGYRWRNVGENIASGQTTPEQVVQEWIASPVHCANLMSPRFTEMGVAYAVNLDSEDGIYWAQMFGRAR